jgi:hypothetical protein
MTNETSNRTDAVKEGASNVATATREEGQRVAGTAKDEMQHVGGEAIDRARDVAVDLRDEARRQANEQGTRVAQALHDASRQLHSMGDATDAGMVADLTHQAASRTEAIASRLDARGVDGVLDDVRSYARRKPGTFLLAAGVAGFIVGRLARNASGVVSGSQNQTTGTPSQPQPALPFESQARRPGAAPSPSTSYGSYGDTIPAAPDYTEAPYFGGGTPPEPFGDGSVR